MLIAGVAAGLTMAVAVYAHADEPRRGLRDDVNRSGGTLYQNAPQWQPGAPRQGSSLSPDQRAARRAELDRLREAVRAGQMSGDDAARSYRERYPDDRNGRGMGQTGGPRGPGGGRMSHEERERLRRDLEEADRRMPRR